MLLENEKEINGEEKKVSYANEGEDSKENNYSITKKLLTDNGVCDICVRNCVSQSSGISVTYKEYDVDELERETASQCSFCLGILRGNHLNAVAMAVVKKVEDLNYESSKFSMGISIPSRVMLYRHSAITYFQEKFPSIDTTKFRSMASIKNLARFFLTKLITKHTSKICDQRTSDLSITIEYLFPDSGQEEVSKLDELESPTKKTKIENGCTISETLVKKSAICPPVSFKEACKFNIRFFQVPIYYAGRYNRYSRTPNQALERGVAFEFVGEKLKELTRASDTKFTTSGIESTDVKILGEGKPFVVEIIDPKVSALSEEQVTKLLDDVKANDGIDVHNIQKVSKAGVDLMRKGEVGKVKTYKVKLLCSENIIKANIKKINGLRDIEVTQATPVRRLHKDGFHVKQNTIHEMEFKRVSGTNYELMLKVSGGTFVHEFIHGDFGRTGPCLATLLDVSFDIDEIDFIHIDINWPPESEDNIDQM